MTSRAGFRPKNIILTGFMGTGKSTVGRLVATKLNREFVDMDTLIEVRAERTIPEIFAESGEAYFRRLEADLCRELAGREGLVIATGGGALVPAENLRVMAGSGLVICLDCRPETLWERIGRSENRPMLAAQDEERFARLKKLLEDRAPAYARIQHHLDATALSPEELAARVCEDYGDIQPQEKRMNLLTVTHPTGSYPIYLAEGGLANTGSYLAELGYQGRCGLVTNDVVGPRHARPVLDSLRRAGFEPSLIHIPDGEQFKTLETVARLYTDFIEARLDRRSPVIALGGGVLGDTAGFAAASFLRGVPFVQIPTTLLAMVDASVGGKTGVDLPQGKNLAGAFKQPELVIVDPQVLATLPEAEYRAGLAEVVKHGLIADPDLFAALEAGQVEPVWMLERAIRVKIRVVEADPFEQGRRAVLNLGHTFAHAFERLAHFEMRHGEAVAMGLGCAARLAHYLGYCSNEVVDRTTTLLRDLQLPLEPPPYSPAAVWAAMATDKKRRGNTLRFILPRAIGDVDIFETVAESAVTAILERH